MRISLPGVVVHGPPGLDGEPPGVRVDPRVAPDRHGLRPPARKAERRRVAAAGVRPPQEGKRREVLGYALIRQSFAVRVVRGNARLVASHTETQR